LSEKYKQNLNDGEKPLTLKNCVVE